MQGSSKGSGLSNKDQENDQDQTMQGSGKGSKVAKQCKDQVKDKD